MGSDMANDTDVLLNRAGGGDRAVWGELLTRHRDRLRRMAGIRLHPRLRGRLDPDDIVQEACVDALRRLPEYLADRPMPFFLWLRFLTGQKLLELERRHLGAKKRAAGNEVVLNTRPAASSADLAARLMGHHTSPSLAAIRAERKAHLEDALNRMDPTDREVLVLRHFEQLSNAEAARELGLQESAASKRYLRSLVRLKDLLADRPGVTPGGSG